MELNIVHRGGEYNVQVMFFREKVLTKVSQTKWPALSDCEFERNIVHFVKVVLIYVTSLSFYTEPYSDE